MAVKEVQASIKIVRPQPSAGGLVRPIRQIRVKLMMLEVLLANNETVSGQYLDDITARVTWLADRLQRMPRG